MRRRPWYVYPLFALLLIALLPFLILCVIFCLKLFLAAAILGFVALALMSAVALLWGGVWLLARAGRRRAPGSGLPSDTSA
jgi:hypothetical protein